MKHVHLIGIGGTGLSAIARLLKESGCKVSGSDQVISPLAQSLIDQGVKVYKGHRANHVAGADVVVISSAVPETNPEIKAARKLGIPVLKRSEFLGSLMQEKISIAVAGTHGKTTTTSMITWMLHQLGRDPSFICGGVIKGLDTNAHFGTGNEFVIEADEYDRMFLGLSPNIAVITTMEHDHPDCYPTMLEYTGAFVDFAASIRPGGTIFVHESVIAIPDMTAKVHKDVSLLSYGANRFADYHAENIHLGSDGFYIFDVAVNIDGNNVNLAKEMHLSVPGQHNVLNAVAALGVADVLGIDTQQAAAALASFSGSGRRFEVVGISDGVTLIDDYAHHPTEIMATLSAARSRFSGQNIWAVWQPHTYSRTRLLGEQFANAFVDADQVIVTEIYASREPVETYSSAQVAALIPGNKTSHIQSLKDTEDYLLNHLKSGDILVVLSAGDADQINKNLLVRLSERTH